MTYLPNLSIFLDNKSILGWIISQSSRYYPTKDGKVIWKLDRIFIFEKIKNVIHRTWPGLLSKETKTEPKALPMQYQQSRLAHDVDNYQRNKTDTALRRKLKTLFTYTLQLFSK